MMKINADSKRLLRLLAAGESQKEIARRLEIKESTLNSRVTRLFFKLGARNSANAVALAIERKIIEVKNAL